MRILVQDLWQAVFPTLWESDLLFQWATTSCLLILAVLLVRRLAKGRLSCVNRYALWAVVLLRLLLPFQLPFLPSLGVTAADLPNVVELVERPFEGRISPPDAPNTPIYNRLPDLAPEDVTGSSFTQLPDDPYHGQYTQRTHSGETVTTIVPIWTRYQSYVFVWTVGAVLIGGVILASNLRFARRLKKRRRALDLPDCPLPVYLAEGLPSPCLFGLFRPAIYLTPEAAALPPEQLGHVLAHELTHHAHLDHIWAAARCLCLALHWYDPLVWLSAVLSKRDGELACDEGAVERLGEGARIPYGRTLVGLVARAPRPGDLLQCSTAMTGGKKNIQRRIALLVKQPQTKTTALFAAAALVALAAVFAFGGGTGNAPSEGSYSTFRSRLSSAQAIRFGMPPTSSYAFPDPITDEDLLEQAKELLGQAEPWSQENAVSFGFQDAALRSHMVSLINEDTTASFYLYPMENGATYVLAYLDETTAGAEPLAILPNGTIAQLQSLAREQNERGQSAGGSESPEVTRYQIDDPDYIARLSDLFLADEETVALNESPDGELADWLTNWTNAYIVEYCVPYWVDTYQAGWYARAIDAGSWYSIQIPDHMVEPVLSLCREAVAKPLRDFLLGASSLISAQSGRMLTIHELREEVTDDGSLSVWPVRFAVVDMDRDGVMEVALQLSVSGNENAAYELLHVQHGEVYGYIIPHRGLQDLKTDGTYGYSNGLGEGTGYCTARFTTQELTDDRFLYYEYDSATSSATYYADGVVVTERQYLALEEEQWEKPDVTWHDFTPENIRAVFP